MPPTFKPAYLIHGDDHGRIAERRAKLCELAETQSGVEGLERFEGDASTPAGVAAALNAMTFAIGRRFLIVDGVERWKDKEMAPLERALTQMPPDTTVTFFAREEGRLKAPSRLQKAIRAAGGDISAEESLKLWELPKWAVTQARQLGLELTPDAARMLVTHVGERQQRLLRELEKLELELGPGAHVDVAEVEALTAASAERRAWALADALLSGSAAQASSVYLALQAQGERLGSLIYALSTRLREAHSAAVALERGEPQAEVRRRLRMPPKAADALLANVRKLGVERLRQAIEAIADLELASRGGTRGASEETLVLRAIRELTR